MQRCVFLLWWMYLTRVDLYRQHRCFSFCVCVCVVLQRILKQMARLFGLRCWDDPGTTGVYIQTYDIYIRIGNIISSAYTFLTTLHASDIQGLLIARTPGPTANWKRCQVNVVGVLGTIALKCQVLRSTPDRYLKWVIILCSYGTGYMLQHLFALKEDVGGNITRMWFHICSCNENNDHKTI